LGAEGVPVRQLLADLSPLDIVTAAADTRTGHVAMGVRATVIVYAWVMVFCRIRLL
jgi:hypothetical protein